MNITEAKSGGFKARVGSRFLLLAVLFLVFLVSCSSRDDNQKPSESSDGSRHLSDAMWAINDDKASELKGYLDNGLLADTIYTTAKKETLLHMASSLRKIGCAEVLLKAGADVNAVSRDGSTPLHLIARNAPPKSDKVAKLLIEHKADLNAKDSSGLTPLHWTTGNDAVMTAKALIDAGAEVNPADNEGQTPLHLAVCCQSFATAKLLVRSGADLSLRTKEGKTALDIARERQLDEIIRILPPPQETRAD
ncbi:MAG: ankyrin repeat domain-containing protein [Phycisphaerae bacterium]|jgi:ankyrin repeat protein|nr:ankyrin repeat domain-containing protein [Phycisphaerae bacterium]